jgi:hypothetical protein
MPAWTAGAGYDLATGLGSVNANNLVNHWSSVGFASTTTVLASLSPATITHGQSVNLTVNVTSASGTPTGSVALVGGPSNSYGISDFPLSKGTVTSSTNLLPGGTYTVTARYGGDGTFGASSSSPPVQVTVNKESSKTQTALVTFDSNNNPTSFTATTAAYGSPYVLRTDVTNSTGQQCSLNPVPCPTGQVTITANGKPLPNQGSGSPGTYTLNNQGYLEDIFVQFPAGSYSVASSYGGDISYQPSSTTVPITITKAAATAAFTPSATSIQYGDSVTLTATISTQSSGAAPTGTVQFYSGSTPLAGTVTYTPTAGSASSTGFAMLQATLSLNLASTGSIQANYSGDGNYTSAISPATTVTVAPGFTFSAKPASFSISAPGQSGSSSLTVGYGPGFSGSVSFSCAVPATMEAATCTATPASLSASGTAMITVATTAPSSVQRHSPLGKKHPPPGTTAPLLTALSLVVALALCRRRLALALPIAVLLLAVSWIACGGGSSSSTGGGGSTGTSPGMYSVTVSATDGSVSHTATISVTVQ